METYIAKTIHGLENVLADELRELGAKEVKTLKRAVKFEATLEVLYRANLSLRTALRILHPIGVEKVENQKQLYDFVHSINWMRWFTKDQTFAVQATVFGAPEFNNSIFVALKAKDAIVDQFRNHKGSRPNVDKDNPDVRVDVHIFKDRCTVSIDSSGASLHKRGYRVERHRAPLNEVLAAGLIKLSGLDGTTTLVDPFCGSGTILAEAGLIAHNKAPNLNRKKFSFFHWKTFDQKLFDKVWFEAKFAIKKESDCMIIGSDISPMSIYSAKANLAAAGVDESVRLSVKSYEDRKAPSGGGMVICNPPYGERLARYDMEALYKGIGDKLKTDFTGYDAWILSSLEKFNRYIGLRPSDKIQLFNGSLECMFLKYELYKGTRSVEK
jgi:putative N6-adenine-specific DNA methylase